MMSEVSSKIDERRSSSPSPTKAVRERRIQEQRTATESLRALNSHPASPGSLASSPAGSTQSSPLVSRRHSILDFDMPGTLSRVRSSSTRSSLADRQQPRRFQMEMDTMMVRHEAQVSSLKAEIHALRVQADARDNKLKDKTAALRDLEIRYASKHGEARELSETVAQLEAQVCRDKAELSKLKGKAGAGNRGKRDEDMVNLLHGATKELQSKRDRIMTLTTERDLLKQQMAAVEDIFLQAMAASGIQDVVDGENGVDCMAALVDEYRLQREENQSLQQLLAESRAQIQGSQTQVLKLQDMLNMIEVSTMDVEAENKALTQEMGKLRQTMKAKDNQLRQLEQYAEDVASLQQELKEARAQLETERQQHQEELDSVRATPPIDDDLAQEIARDDAEAAMMAAQRISDLEDVVHHQQERIEELKRALAQQIEDAMNEQGFLRNEVERFSNAAVTAAESLQQLKEAYETEIELLKMDMEEKDKLLSAKDAEVATVRQDAEQSMIELSTTLTAIKSVFNEEDQPPELTETSHMAMDLMKTVDSWKNTRDQRLHQAKQELAVVNSKLHETCLALKQLDESPIRTDETGMELEELHAEQAEQVISTAHQLEITRRKLESAKRQLAGIRVARRIAQSHQASIDMGRPTDKEGGEADDSDDNGILSPLIRLASEGPELQSAPSSPGHDTPSHAEAETKEAQSTSSPRQSTPRISLQEELAEAAAKEVKSETADGDEEASEEGSVINDINPTLLHPHWRSSIDMTNDDNSDEDSGEPDNIDPASSEASLIAADDLSIAADSASQADLSTDSVLPTRNKPKKSTKINLFEDPPEHNDVFLSSTPLSKTKRRTEPAIGVPQEMASIQAGKLRELLAIQSEHAKLKRQVSQLELELEEYAHEHNRLEESLSQNFTDGSGTKASLSDNADVYSGTMALLQHVAQLQDTNLPVLDGPKHVLLFAALQFGQLLKTVGAARALAHQRLWLVKLTMVVAMLATVFTQALHWPMDLTTMAIMAASVVLCASLAGLGFMVVRRRKQRLTVSMGWLSRASSLTNESLNTQVTASLRQSLLQATQDDTRSLHVTSKGHLDALASEADEVLRKHLMQRLEHVLDEDDDATLDLRTVGPDRRHALLHLSAQTESQCDGGGQAFGFLTQTAGLAQSRFASAPLIPSQPSWRQLTPCLSALLQAQFQVLPSKRLSDAKSSLRTIKAVELTYRADARLHSQYRVYMDGLRAIAQAFKRLAGGKLGVQLSTAESGTSPPPSVCLPLMLTNDTNEHVWSAIHAAQANPIAADLLAKLLQARITPDVSVVCMQPQPSLALTDDNVHFGFVDTQSAVTITLFALGDRVTLTVTYAAAFKDKLQPLIKRLKTGLP
eukprot:TRINITY_DN11725_c0_g2_i3.p1 TRINITY_DN11725_c0_g2~~TRINITY_DN11725_c0_g2_i3.p1  ORF type:complete len:1364 (+),score=452.54 TRINITY_DN11725_c0_g2_i3:135-4226(+)